MASQDSGIETGNDSNDSSYLTPQESKDASQIKVGLGLGIIKCNVGAISKLSLPRPTVLPTVALDFDVSDLTMQKKQEKSEMNIPFPMFRLPTPRSVGWEMPEPVPVATSTRSLPFEVDPPAGLSFRNLQPSSLGLGNGYEIVVGPGLRKMRTCHCRCSRRVTPRDSWMQFKIPLDERKLRTAVSVNNADLVESLLASGVNPNTSDVHKRSPLHLASCRGYANIVKMLLDKGANPNLKDSLGNTPLHIAACTNNIEVVTLLIKAGADLSSGDNCGRSPLQIAQSKLKLLQRTKSEDAARVKAEVAQVVEMMQTFLHKRGQDMEAELLSAFSSRLSLSDTPDKVETDVRDLLASLSGLTLYQ